MPDQDNTNTMPPADPVTPVTGDDTSAPITPEVTSTPTEPLIPDIPTSNLPENHTDNSAIIADVATKIGEAHNILVALSSDPSVDEMSAAIGLALYLDRLGKRVTAIYSGTTPNALKFLNPEETFEKNADILQDFVIALNKEKADHLRYKLDGDYVKIFITPYRSKITSDDLEFSYGDFNVDLVLALDVANGIDLDDALREHGRIMHDAVVINITTGRPGKLGEIEWSDKTASSVSEMIVELLFGMNVQALEKEEATAFLTGIVAATNRFASASTTSKTMHLASRLMERGANQQLISKNITPDVENEMFSFGNVTEKTTKDDTKLDIQHGNEKDVDEDKEVTATVTEKESTLLADLKAAEDSLAQVATEVTPDTTTEKVVMPSPDLLAEPTEDEANKYGQMLEAALAETGNDDTPTAPIVSAPPLEDAPASDSDSAPSPVSNPALASAPTVATEPEINGVPEMNYMPPADAEILPPPPTPPIDLDSDTPMTLPTPDASLNSDSSLTPLGSQPAMQDQVYRPQVSNPDAFKIPGT